MVYLSGLGCSSDRGKDTVEGLARGSEGDEAGEMGKER